MSDERQKPHLSPSQIKTYQNCGLIWENRYVKGIKSPPGIAAVVGKATHESVEANLRGRIGGGEAMPLAQAKAIAGDALSRAWADEAPLLSAEDREKGVDKVRGEAIDKSVALAGLHHAEVAPNITPAAVELPFRLELEDAEYDIVGYKDIVEESGVIRDTKTTGKSPSADAAEKSDQLAVYAWDAAVSGNPAPEVALDYLVSTKVPKYLPLIAKPDEIDFERVRVRAAAVWKGIKAGVFIPAPRDSWICAPKWCGYWNDCPHGARGATVVPVTRARHVNRPTGNWRDTVGDE